MLALFLLVLTNSQRLELKLNLKLKVNKIIYTEACPGTIVAMYPYSRDLVGLHIGDAAAASGTESGGGVFTQVAPLSVPLKWVLTCANPAAQCRYEPPLHALFF